MPERHERPPSDPFAPGTTRRLPDGAGVLIGAGLGSLVWLGVLALFW